MIHVPFNDPAPDPRKTPDHFKPGDRVMALGNFGKSLDTLGTVEEAKGLNVAVMWDNNVRMTLGRPWIKKV